MKNNTEVVMIVLNYNDSDTTIKYINLIKDYNSVDHIIIVDNASTDDSVNKIKPYINGKIEMVVSLDNCGYASGNNCGLRYACEKYPDCTHFIVSNPDIVVSNSSISSLVSYLQSNDTVALATGIIRGLDGRVVSNFGWRLPSESQILLNSFYSTYYLTNKILERGIYFKYDEHDNNPIKVDAVPGCFFVVKAEVMKAIGFFDEDTFLFCEENIIGYKIKEMNLTSIVLPTVEIIHENSVSISKSIKKSYEIKKILCESYIVYLKKYLKKNSVSISFFSCLYKLSFLDDLLIHRIRKLLNSLNNKKRYENKG